MKVLKWAVIAGITGLAGIILILPILGEIQRHFQKFEIADPTKPVTLTVKDAWGWSPMLFVHVQGRLDGMADIEISPGIRGSTSHQSLGPGDMDFEFRHDSDGDSDCTLRFIPKAVKSGRLTIHYRWDAP